MTKILVVGAGSIGRRHHDNLQALGAESTLRGWRGYGLAGVEAEIAEFDGVVIATATDTRLELIRLAAAKEKPLYIEKPLAVSLEELAAIEAEIAEVAPRSVLGYMMRYHPAFRDLCQRDLSNIFQFSFSIGQDVTQWRQNWKFSESYAARAYGGGILLDLCHEIDMADCLLGRLSCQEVLSQGHKSYEGVDMASQLTLRGPRAIGTVSMDYLTPQLHRRAILRGSEASYDFDFARQIYARQGFDGSQNFDHPLERNKMFLDIMRDFLALVAGGRVSDVEHLPRLDLSLPSARLVSTAWEKRRFIGEITKDIP